jgi:inosose dehydratase
MDRFKGLRVGMQSYTFRKFSLEDTVAAVADLGLKEIEFCKVHVGVDSSSDEQAEARAAVAGAGLSVRAYGVSPFVADADENRRLFEFAKAWGVEVLTAHPTAESFDNLEALTEEYGVNIAIHNHGPDSPYPDAATIRKAVAGRSTRIGLSVDTGHFLRVPGEDPVAILDEFADRIHSVHLKDMNPDHEEYILDDGPLDLSGVLDKLIDIGFGGPLSIEYELDPEDPMPAMRETLARIEAALA